MKKNLFPTLLLAAGIAFGAVSAGISIGVPPPPRVAAIPASPGSDYTRVAGYWYPVSGRYVWHDGYWSGPVGASSTIMHRAIIATAISIVDNRFA
jgi:hypothetical protein